MAEEEKTVAETARTLRVTLHHVYALIWAGRLIARKVQGQWRISADAVQARQKETGKK
jgi:excisionase family DNA binding protein